MEVAMDESTNAMADAIDWLIRVDAWSPQNYSAMQARYDVMKDKR